MIGFLKGATMLRNRKRLLILALGLIVVASLIEFGRLAFETTRAQTRTGRERWEYCTVNTVTPGSGGWKAQIHRGTNVDNVESDISGISTINRLGVDGWELVSVVHESGNSVEYFLKRQLR
jgi:hypothetical protein